MADRVIEQSAIGRIVVPAGVPEGHALFYTTVDFDGRDLDAVNGVVRECFGIDARLLQCNQVHGVSVSNCGGVDVCDALWCDRTAALAIKVADCLPVSIIAGRVIANIHSGWRGTAQRIVDVTLDALPPFDSNAAAAWLGPSIRVCCFEVGEEVVETFRAAYGNADDFVDRSHAKPHLDLPALTTAVLRERGIARVHDSGLCTRCNGSIFHSYRRDGKRGGRNLAVLAQR